MKNLEVENFATRSLEITLKPYSVVYYNETKFRNSIKSFFII
jgi:hypothetical protein